MAVTRNGDALAFYQRVGFVIVGIVTTEFGSGVGCISTWQSNRLASRQAPLPTSALSRQGDAKWTPSDAASRILRWTAAELISIYFRRPERRGGVEAPCCVSKRWEGGDRSDEVEQETVDVFAQGVTTRIYGLVSDRLYEGASVEWNRALALTGPVQPAIELDLLRTNIYERAAPIPGELPSPERTEFLQALRSAVVEAEAEAGAVLLPSA